ncbi:MAG: leucine--tRNA ligase [Anaerolineales bacterium]|nr:leucine--tRNA ligase [Anaerolineales bacterium]
MTEKYDPKSIEQKWQQQWEADGLYRSTVDWDKPKHYALTMLPYPSGDLHMGHWFAMAPSDARARYMRMKGYNVLFPMGFDAFGLPAENAAVQRNIHPAKWTYANIERMRQQLRSMGAMFDWEREAVSCDPDYYKWTEWFFKEFYENDLAYRGEALVNWSPTLQTVLANEQVIDGKDERTGQPVIQKMMTQWFFRYKAYADEMLDFSHIDWPEPIKIMQTNWIGRSEGARVTFHTEQGDPLEIYTTRPDTLWGATFMVLSPEHPLVDVITTPAQKAEVTAYVEGAAGLTEIERSSESREKTGVFTGGYAINPVNQAKVPIWIADYVLITYGTGAIMAVPAHDERDFAFARKFGLEIIPVIQPEGMADTLTAAAMDEAFIGPGHIINSGPIDGTPVNMEKGRKNPSINAAITWLEEHNAGEEAINYRLRDWLISRQRYWGSPIPIIHTEDGSMMAVPDDQLPVLLPEDVDFMPSGRSPLTYEESFLKTTAPDGSPARRETDTMDTFMCSSWYWYRYLSPHYAPGPFDPEEAAYWLPVDVYTGGAEHATMHLLYARWFAKAMRDLGVFDDAMDIMKQHGRDPEEMTWGEPMLLLRNQGQILGEEREGDYILASGRWEDDKLFADKIEVIDPSHAPKEFDGVAGEIMRRTENILRVGNAEQVTVVELLPDAEINIPDIPGENSVNQLKHHLEIQRMSKSKGNVVNPDELVEQYGSDTVRATLMFAFDWQKGGPWSSRGVKGPRGLIEDVWKLVTATDPAVGQPTAAQIRDLRRKTHQTIAACTRDIETFSFNTYIAALMAFRNVLQEAAQTALPGSDAWNEAIETLLLLMAPITPHIAEELWARIGRPYSIHQQAWPVSDPELAKEDTVEIAVQVNGKVRDKISIPVDIDPETAKSQAMAAPGIQSYTDGKTPVKVIYVPGRLVNIVVK